MKDALAESLKKPNIDILKNIRIYVAQDCTIFKQDVINMCTRIDAPSEASFSTTKTQNQAIPSSFIPCIILISARLGGEELNEVYVDSLKMFLEIETCLGIIGGKPKHSLYFVGYQGEKVIYLDPHFCQPTVNVFSNSEKKLSSSLTQLSASLTSKHSYDDTCLTTSSMSSSSDFDLFDNSSFHCGNPSKVAFTKLDPSIAIGFYCKTLSDLNELCDLVKETSINDKVYPIFGVSEGSFDDAQLNYNSFSLDEKLLTSKMSVVADKKEIRAKSSISDTFEKTYSGKLNNSRVESNNVKSSSTTIASYLTNKLANKMQTEPKKNLLSPSKNKKPSKKSTDPDDFVLV